MTGELTSAQVARRAGVSAQTLARWVRQGVVDAGDGWTPAAAAQARMVARLRGRGHSLAEIRAAVAEGRLAFGYVEELFGGDGRPTATLREAAERAGLEPALAERVLSGIGISADGLQRLSDDDVRFLRYVASVLDSGFPLVALLQLTRVYGQALAQISDAEVRLFHLYVHEPLMREGVPGLQMAEEMEGLARAILPLASPIMDHVHQRFLSLFLEQDVVGHMESDLGGDGSDLGRMRVAIAFADLAGYTRLTEEQGDEEAVSVVERFIDAVEATLPDDARIIKTIGDAVMVVGADPGALTDWAVGFQTLYRERPRPRIGLHAGAALYREGDYYGGAVNLAARVVARAGGGEVLVTRSVVDAAGGHLAFERIGEVRLKGFQAPTELFAALLHADG